MKTHKPPEEVGLRNVHALSRYAFGGLGRHVHIKLEEVLKEQCPRLLRSAEEWVNKTKYHHVKSRFLDGEC